MATQRLSARLDALRELVVARMQGVLNSLRREEVVIRKIIAAFSL
jgi:hypothetical protein